MSYPGREYRENTYIYHAPPGPPPPNQPMYQSPPGQPMYQAPPGQPMYQPPSGQPMYQSQSGQPMYQPQAGQPMYQPPPGQPMYPQPSPPMYQQAPPTYQQGPPPQNLQQGRMMQFVWEKNDPVNSSILSGDNRPMYKADTPWKLRHRTTTITGHDEQALASVEWHYFTPATLKYRGQEMSVDDWLTVISPLALSRAYNAPDGRQYNWIHDIGFNKWRLFDAQTDAVVAESSPAKKVGWKDSEHMTLQVHPQASGFYEDVLLGFVIMEFKFRQQQSHQTQNP